MILPVLSNFYEGCDAWLWLFGKEALAILICLGAITP